MRNHLDGLIFEGMIRNGLNNLCLVEKDINDMMFENDWEIKDEFLQNEINEISNPNFISYSFQKYLNNFNTNKNECNWELYMKKS